MIGVRRHPPWKNLLYMDLAAGRGTTACPVATLQDWPDRIHLVMGKAMRWMGEFPTGSINGGRRSIFSSVSVQNYNRMKTQLSEDQGVSK